MSSTQQSPPGTPIDFEPLAINVAGIDLRVWGMEHLSGEEVAVMFFLHGRQSNKEQVEPAMKYILPRVWKSKASSPNNKDLLMVALDLRNHGSRTVDPKANLAFDENPRHAVDMYSIQTGSALDISHLVSFLPSYLFPDAAKSPITTWICAGVSLGGHTAWLAGAKDPRITHLLPIIGSPDYASLLEGRAKQHGLSLTAPHWPRSLDTLVRTCDPVNLPVDLWMGKHILAICGGRDELVPVRGGGTEAFVASLRAAGMGERMRLRVDEGAGHEVTGTMFGWMVDWLLEDVLVTPSSRL